MTADLKVVTALGHSLAAVESAMAGMVLSLFLVGILSALFMEKHSANEWSTGKGIAI